MHYRMYAPAAALKDYVRYFWESDFYSDQPAETVIESFADRYPQLIFQNLDGRQPIVGNNGNTLTGIYLRGVVTVNPSYTLTNSFSHLGISFYPHAIQTLFHVDAHELVNQWPDICNFCSWDISEALHEAADNRERINMLNRFLMDRLRRRRPEDKLIKHLLQARNLPVNSSVHDILSNFNISERQLERKFKSVIGIPPKTYLRIIRFEKAVNILNSAIPARLSSIAYELGYADQSHFIRDFKKSAGITPLAFLKKQRTGEENSSFVINTSFRDAQGDE
ncbi:helix-turn-helix domain-containing protein [Foetidibacter luteolus]|uniref:helix-turn-helix domain-containing protein n=1 Tax=Foetidibacter luteolus TaxID=2608880 RepID=UPI00129B756A|nr:helix-turn-helix domain-containing protein [Foetidibacter luteolus]